MNLINKLKEIGFNRLEAKIYIELQKEPYLSGYRISKNLNEPLSNTYKALEIMEEKKCIISYKSKKAKTYSAVEISSYIEQKQKDLEIQKTELKEEFKKISSPVETEGIYLLNSVDEVYNKAKIMIENAKTNILVDAYPQPLQKIKPFLEKAADKGIDIMVQTSSELEIKNCEILEPEHFQENFTYWPCDWFNLVADGEEFLLAFLKKDGKGIFHAVWSKSPYVSILIYYNFVQEIQQIELKRMIKAGTSVQEISEKNTDIFNRLFSKISGNKRIKELMLKSL